MKTPAEYWVAVGTILPVLALALVVEARSLASTWTSKTPRVLRAIQAFLWVSPLIAATVSEDEILRALRGVTVSSWVSWLCDATIVFSFSVLVLSPAIDLLSRGYAEFVAPVFTVSPVRWMKFHRLKRSIEHAHRLSRRGRKEFEGGRSHSYSMLTDIEMMIDKAEAEGVPTEQVEQHRGQLEQQRAWTDQQYAEFDTRWDAAEARQAEASELYRQGVENLRIQKGELRHLRTELLIRDGLGGPVGQQHSTTAASGQLGESAQDDDDTSS